MGGAFPFISLLSLGPVNQGRGAEMEAADKGLQGGASLYVDNHLDAGEGDPVDHARGNLLQEPQSQPVAPHTALAAQGLQAEGQQSAALLPVRLQQQVSAGERGSCSWAGVVLQLRWDVGKGVQVLGGVMQAHMQDGEGRLHGREPGRDGTQTEQCDWSQTPL